VTKLTGYGAPSTSATETLEKLSLPSVKNSFVVFGVSRSGDCALNPLQHCRKSSLY
jgi:hypothetical protein